METNATANAAPIQEVTYPRLMQRGDGAIAIFTDEVTATIIHSDNPNELGDHSEYFEIIYWEPYIGTVTLES